MTRNLPKGGLVDRLRRFCFHLPRYPSYGALTSTPAGLSPAEHASLSWTHVGSRTGAPAQPSVQPCHVSSPRHVARSVRISRTARSHLLRVRVYNLSYRGNFRPAVPHLIAVE